MIGMRGKYNEDALRVMCSELGLSGKIMVEIGSYSGESAVIFAEFCKKVYAIDPWKVDMELSDTLTMGAEVEIAFDEKVKTHKNIIKIKAFDHDVIDDFDDNSLDFVYIDALHTEKEVKRQIEMWLPKLKKGGIMGGHDYEIRGIQKAVKKTLGEPDKLYTDGGQSWSKKI